MSVISTMIIVDYASHDIVQSLSKDINVKGWKMELCCHNANKKWNEQNMRENKNFTCKKRVVFDPMRLEKWQKHSLVWDKNDKINKSEGKKKRNT